MLLNTPTWTDSISIRASWTRAGERDHWSGWPWWRRGCGWTFDDL